MLWDRSARLPWPSNRPRRTTSWWDSITSPVKKGFSKIGDFFTPKPAAKAPGAEDDAISLKSKGKPGPELYVAVARLYEQSHKLADAEQQYQLALKDKPDYLPALLGYAQLKEQLGQPDEALRLYQRAAKAYPREAAVYNNMGLYYAKLGRADEAVATMTRAVALAPKNPRYRNNIATVLVDQGRLHDAFAHLQAAHGEAAAYYNMGYLLNKKGQTQAAMQHFALALKADPSMAAAQRWLEYLQRSTAQDRLVAASGGRRRKDHQRKGAGGGVVAARRADAPPAAADPVGRSVLRRAVVAGCFSGPLGRSHGPDAAGERQLRRSAVAPNELKPRAARLPLFTLCCRISTLRRIAAVSTARLTAVRLPPGRKRFRFNGFRTVEYRGTANYSQRHDDCTRTENVQPDMIVFPSGSARGPSTHTCNRIVPAQGEGVCDEHDHVVSRPWQQAGCGGPWGSGGSAAGWSVGAGAIAAPFGRSSTARGAYPPRGRPAFGHLDPRGPRAGTALVGHAAERTVSLARGAPGPAGRTADEPAGELSPPLQLRARLLRAMKTVRSMQEVARQASVQRLASVLVAQILEIMPELKDTIAWPAVGHRRKQSELGQAFFRGLSLDLRDEMEGPER